MQIASPRYFAFPGRNAIVDALTPMVQSWFAETITEPIPEELAAILQRMDSSTTAKTPKSRSSSSA
jgi:hypothetical protein